MKLGILFCAYGIPEYLEQSINPWIEAKKKFNIKIAAVHGQFKENHELGYEDNDIGTLDKLYPLARDNKIDFLYVQNPPGYIDAEKKYQTEAEIRNKGLQFLLKEKVDYVILLDLDEFYTETQIENILNYINREDNRLITWFSIPMKNYIFDGKCYIKGFSPPRIFKNYINGYKISEMYWDNDIKYVSINNSNESISYKNLSSKDMPENVINGGVRHMTWLHSNGEQKEKYQIAHFNGECSYHFNVSTQKLEFNLDYYKRHGIPLPNVYFDDSP